MVVFDIDDTIIYSNSGEIIDDIHILYNYCRFLGINVSFITARIAAKNVIDITMNQLKSYGIDYSFLFLRPMFNNDIVGYKTSCRKNLVESGYDIIFSIGDQYFDIGDYGGIGILIGRK